MNAKYRQVLICSVVAAMLFSSAPAHAWFFCGDSEKAMECTEERKEKFIKELGLTPEQEEQIKALRSGQKEKRGELWVKIQAKRLELKEELEKPTTDRARIDSIVTELKALMAEKLDQRVEGILSMKKILTPEQYEKFKEEIEVFKDGMKDKYKGMKKKHRKGF